MAASALSSIGISASHVSVAAQRLEPAAVGGILGATRALGDVREAAASQLLDDVAHGSGARFDRFRTRRAAERAVARAVAAVEIQADDRDLLALDVLPDVQLGPIE